jgi:hypothetical protein
MSSHEFAEWQAYYRLDPFGLDRGDYHAAMICWTIYNRLRGSAPPAELSEFLPEWRPSVEPSGRVDAFEKFSAQMELLGGGRG